MQMVQRNILLQVSRKALYVVKDCKTMLNRLSTRVGKMKQVLEDILNDDQEMQDMYLGRRAGKLIISFRTCSSLSYSCYNSILLLSYLVHVTCTRYDRTRFDENKVVPWGHIVLMLHYGSDWVWL